VDFRGRDPCGDYRTHLYHEKEMIALGIGNIVGSLLGGFIKPKQPQYDQNGQQAPDNSSTYWFLGMLLILIVALVIVSKTKKA
jgi:hypothetical protein